MLSLSLSLAVILILIFCAWQGFKKGLILTICSLVAVLVAANAGGRVATRFAGEASDKLLPVLNWLPEAKIDEAILEVIEEYGPIDDDSDAIEAVCVRSYDKIGITGSFQKILVEKAIGDINIEKDLKTSIADNFLYAMAYLILCIFGFLVVYILLSLLYHFVAALIQLPSLGLVDKIGGAILGLTFGLIMMCACGWAMRFIGIFLPADMFTQSSVVSAFMNLKWLDGFLNLNLALLT
jgi:uncharacterized membrane protein required for colicin V production